MVCAIAGLNFKTEMFLGFFPFRKQYLHSTLGCINGNLCWAKGKHLETIGWVTSKQRHSRIYTITLRLTCPIFKYMERAHLCTNGGSTLSGYMKQREEEYSLWMGDLWVMITIPCFQSIKFKQFLRNLLHQHFFHPFSVYFILPSSHTMESSTITKHLGGIFTTCVAHSHTKKAAVF